MSFSINVKDLQSYILKDLCKASSHRIIKAVGVSEHNILCMLFFMGKCISRLSWRLLKCSVPRLTFITLNHWLTSSATLMQAAGQGGHWELWHSGRAEGSPWSDWHHWGESRRALWSFHDNAGPNRKALGVSLGRKGLQEYQTLDPNCFCTGGGSKITGL